MTDFEHWVRISTTSPGTHRGQNANSIFLLLVLSEAVLVLGRTVCRAIDGEDNLTGKTQLRRIVAMLSKRVARYESVSETPSVYATRIRARAPLR